jgi:hypothetical protein
MKPFPTGLQRDGDRLGSLAMRFRGTRSEAERRAIADDYAQTVGRLIRSGHWDDCPAPEDQLPDEWMPKMFAEFWYRQGSE